MHISVQGGSVRLQPFLSQMRTWQDSLNSRLMTWHELDEDGRLAQLLLHHAFDAVGSYDDVKYIRFLCLDIQHIMKINTVKLQNFPEMPCIRVIHENDMNSGLDIKIFGS